MYLKFVFKLYRKERNIFTLQLNNSTPFIQAELKMTKSKHVESEWIITSKWLENKDIEFFFIHSFMYIIRNYSSFWSIDRILLHYNLILKVLLLILFDLGYLSIFFRQNLSSSNFFKYNVSENWLCLIYIKKCA